MTKQECLDHYDAWKSSGLSKSEYARKVGWDDAAYNRWFSRVRYYLNRNGVKKVRNVFTPVEVRPAAAAASITVLRDGKVIQASGLSLADASKLLNL